MLLVGDIYSICTTEMCDACNECCKLSICELLILDISSAIKQQIHNLNNYIQILNIIDSDNFSHIWSKSCDTYLYP